MPKLKSLLLGNGAFFYSSRVVFESESVRKRMKIRFA